MGKSILSVNKLICCWTVVALIGCNGDSSDTKDVYDDGDSGKGNTVTTTPFECPMDNIVAIAGTSDDDAWFIGSEKGTVGDGIAMHFNGKEWSWQTVSGSSLTGIWVYKRGVVYVTGGKSILRYDGGKWTEIYSNKDPIFGVHGGISGTSDMEMAAVGSDVVVRYDGQKWTNIPITGGAIASIIKISKGRYLAVGREGKIGYVEGTKWTGIENELYKEDLFAVWGIGQEDIYIAGNETVLKYDGVSLTSAVDINNEEQAQMVEARSFTSIWGTSSQNIYVVGSGMLPMEPPPQPPIMRYDGKVWKEVEYGDDHMGTINAVWGTSEKNIYVGGQDISNAGRLYRYDGEDWKMMCGHE